jgi:hypothetical protein
MCSASVSMSRAWPDVWATPQAARDWLRTNAVVFPLRGVSYQGKLHSVRFLRVHYQRAGPKQNWHEAWVDPGVVPDSRAWLEARLGPLAGFKITVICFTLKADDFALGGLDFATPALTVRPSPGQERPPWSTPVMEEIFVTPEEVAALWKVPSVQFFVLPTT